MSSCHVIYTGLQGYAPVCFRKLSHGGVVIELLHPDSRVTDCHQLIEVVNCDAGALLSLYSVLAAETALCFSIADHHTEGRHHQLVDLCKHTHIYCAHNIFYILDVHSTWANCE